MADYKTSFTQLPADALTGIFDIRHGQLEPAMILHWGLRAKNTTKSNAWKDRNSLCGQNLWHEPTSCAMGLLLLAAAWALGRAGRILFCFGVFLFACLVPALTPAH